MTSTGHALADFLLARLAEDEAVALAVMNARTGAGHSDAAWAVASLPEPAATHVIRWAPKRVLADVEVKRAVVTRPPYRYEDGALSDEAWGEWERVVRELAQPYAGAPGWREEWVHPL